MSAKTGCLIGAVIAAWIASGGSAGAQITTGAGGYHTPSGMSSGALYGGGSLPGAYYSSSAYFATPYRSPYSTSLYPTAPYSAPAARIGGFPGVYSITGGSVTGMPPGYFYRPPVTDFNVLSVGGLSFSGINGLASQPVLGLDYYITPSPRRWWAR